MIHSEAPTRHYWPYRWTNRPTGASGIAETIAPLTAQEWERLLMRWTVAGDGQWLYEPLDLSGSLPKAVPIPYYFQDNEHGW